MELWTCQRSQELVASTGRLLTAVSQQKLPSLAVRFQAAVLCSAVDTVRHIGQPDRHIFDVNMFLYRFLPPLTSL